MPAPPQPPRLTGKPGAWNELALTLPVFLTYQLGVVFLNVRNATDVVTSALLDLAHGDRVTYLAITVAIGTAMVLVFGFLGEGRGLSLRKVLQIVIEGTAYAIAMSSATSWLVGKMFASAPPPPATDPFAGLIMSFGAGFHEELAFRVVLFGLGAKLLVWIFARQKVGFVRESGPLKVDAILVMIAWALASAATFSGVHYMGVLGDKFDLRSFAARGVLGLSLTLIYATRGFAAAVWTHSLYDVWVMVL
jgi:hypothetical protein